MDCFSWHETRELAPEYIHQALLVSFFMGPQLACSSHNSADEVAGNESEPEALSIDNKCYSCTQNITTDDTCGLTLIGSFSSKFSFTEDESGYVTLNIADQMSLAGTFNETEVSLINSSAYYLGPGCDMHFENVTFTVTLLTQDTIDYGWHGNLSFDLTLLDEADCDSFSYTFCRAVHTVTCMATGC